MQRYGTLMKSFKVGGDDDDDFELTHQYKNVLQTKTL